MALLQLPLELLDHTAEYLPTKDIGNLRLCCRDLHTALNPFYYRRIRNNGQVMQQAIREGNLNVLEQLLAAGTNPDLGVGHYEPTKYHWNPFQNYQHIRWIWGGPMPNPRFGSSYANTQLGHLLYLLHLQLWTPLHYAIRQGHHDVVSLLLEKGANVHALSRRFYLRDDYHENPWWMPLYTAICHNDPKMVQLLLAAGASFKISTRPLGSSSNYVTALHASSFTGNLEISRLLLDHFQPPIDIEDHYGRSPLSIAFEQSHWDTVEWLVQNGANVNAKIANGQSLLLSACTWDRFAQAYRLLQLGADLHPDTFNTFTPLHMCCTKDTVHSRKRKEDPRKDDPQQEGLQQIDRLTLVKALVERGADVNAERTDNGRTPLMSAASDGFFSVVKYLIKAGADVNARDSHGQTTLSGVCRLETHSNSDPPIPLFSIVEYLLGWGASAIITNNDGHCPFELLCLSGKKHPEKKDIARILLGYGPPSVMADSLGGHLIRRLVRSNDFEICDLLLELGAPPPDRISLGMMLSTAARDNNVEAFQYALQFVDAPGAVYYGTHLLFTSLENNQPRMAEILLDAGAPWSCLFKGGWTCLQHACRIGNLQIVEKLLAAGAGSFRHLSGCTGINQFNKKGQSPLRIAIKGKNHALCMILLDHGADPLGAPPNKASSTCDLEFAIAYGMVDLVRSVIDRGLVSPNSPQIPGIMSIACYRPPGRETKAFLEMFLRLGVDENIEVKDLKTQKLCRPLDILKRVQNSDGIDLLRKFAIDAVERSS